MNLENIHKLVNETEADIIIIASDGEEGYGAFPIKDEAVDVTKTMMLLGGMVKSNEDFRKALLSVALNVIADNDEMANDTIAYLQTRIKDEEGARS